jgi:hypothetical protein
MSTHHPRRDRAAPKTRDALRLYDDPFFGSSRRQRRHRADRTPHQTRSTKHLSGRLSILRISEPGAHANFWYSVL